jgi:formate-dependent nitrite reductase membrane component NrfD
MPLQRCVYAFTVLFHPALSAMKSAILVLYLRLGKAHPFLRRSSLFTLAIVILSGTVLTFLCIFQCRPVDATFDEVQGS